MLKNKYLWIVAVLLLAAVAVFFLKRKPASPAATPPQETKVEKDPATPLPTDIADPALLPKRDVTDEFKDPRLKILSQQDDYTPSLEELAGFLAAHQRSPESLLAAFAVCKDPALLDELMTAAPGERTFQAVMLWSDDDDTVAKAAEEMKKLSPKNPMPYLVQIARGGDLEPEQLKQVLEMVGDSPKIDLSSLRQPALRDEAWQSVVKDPVKAWAYSLQSMNLDLETLDTVSNGILDLQMSSQSEDGETTDGFVKTLALSKALRSDSSEISSIADPKVNGLELEILGAADPESKYPGSSIKVQERIDQLEAKMSDEDSLDNQMQEFLKGADPAAVDTFVAGWRANGMNAALKSLGDGEKH